MIDLFEIHDADAAEAAGIQLIHLQSQLDEALLRWSILRLLRLCDLHPGLSAIGISSGRADNPTQREKPRLHVGMRLPADPSWVSSYAKTLETRYAPTLASWPAEHVAAMAELDDALQSWGEDPRLDPLMREIDENHNVGPHFGPSWLGTPDGEPFDGASLCAALGRPQLWAEMSAQIEQAQLAKAAGPAAGAAASGLRI